MMDKPSLWGAPSLIPIDGSRVECHKYGLGYLEEMVQLGRLSHERYEKIINGEEDLIACLNQSTK